MSSYRSLCALRLACVLLAPLFLTQCSLLQSAGGLLMAPVRLAQATLAEESTAPGGALSEEQWRQRGEEIQRRGEFRGLQAPEAGHGQSMAARLAAAHNP